MVDYYTLSIIKINTCILSSVNILKTRGLLATSSAVRPYCKKKEQQWHNIDRSLVMTLNSKVFNNFSYDKLTSPSNELKPVSLTELCRWLFQVCWFIY